MIAKFKIFFYEIERHCWVDYDYYKKKSLKRWRRAWKRKWKIETFYLHLSTLFRNKDFISQESPILADVENIYSFFGLQNFQELPISKKRGKWEKFNWLV